MSAPSTTREDVDVIRSDLREIAAHWAPGMYGHTICKNADALIGALLNERAAAHAAWKRAEGAADTWRDEAHRYAKERGAGRAGGRGRAMTALRWLAFTAACACVVVGVAMMGRV